ncbi:MAG: hypothetical protein IT330_00920 [Anaerolineae bacterium]|nr:hypothetical protein [Anaerolineae bacterium]
MSAPSAKNTAFDSLAWNPAAYDKVLARLALLVQEKPADNLPVCLVCGRPVTLQAGTGRVRCRCGYTHALARHPA